MIVIAKALFYLLLQKQMEKLLDYIIYYIIIMMWKNQFHLQWVQPLTSVI